MGVPLEMRGSISDPKHSDNGRAGVWGKERARTYEPMTYVPSESVVEKLCCRNRPCLFGAEPVEAQRSRNCRVRDAPVADVEPSR